MAEKSGTVGPSSSSSSAALTATQAFAELKRAANTVGTTVANAAAKVEAQAQETYSRVASSAPKPVPGTHAQEQAEKILAPGDAAVKGSGVPKAQDFWAQEFEGSPVPGVGKKGLFPVHAASESQEALLDNGRDAFEARIQILQNAKTSIRMQALIFRNDEAGQAIAKILKEKKKQGLDVRVVVDYASNLDFPTQCMYYDLMLHGITVEGYEAAGLGWLNEMSTKDLGQIDKRFHDKMLVVDAEDPKTRVAIIGGRNVANEYFDLGSEVKTCWRDSDRLEKGPQVADIAATFDRNYKDQEDIKKSLGDVTNKAWTAWRRLKPSDLNYPVKVNAVSQAMVDAWVKEAPTRKFVTRRTIFRFVQSRPRDQYKETYIHQAYTHLFRAAQKELLVENAYFIPDDKNTAKARKNMLLNDQAHIDALKDAARRGVKVTIITNSAESNDLPQMAFASRYLYQELLAVNQDPETIKNGGKLVIAEWNPKKKDPNGVALGTLHAKHAVADGRYGVGGSYNLDPRSFGLNSETAGMTEGETNADEAEGIRYVLKYHTDIITPKQAAQFHKPMSTKEMAQMRLSVALSTQF